MQLEIIGYGTFRRHAKSYLEPAIIHKWNTDQQQNFDNLQQQGGKVAVAGDMRADSPGHSAKFGSYTLMNLGSNTILDFQLVQSNEVGGSYHMEKEGLKRCLDHLESKDLAVEYIVTDSHPQIQKYLRERNIEQFYDVWHFEKGLSKKLLKLTQNKDCDTKLKRWLRSIKNHVYWSATSTTSGPEKVARWTSLVNHLQNVHVHDDPLFPKCTHPVGAASDANKPYLKGSITLARVETILTNKRVLKDVLKLSHHYQTSSLESFHNLILRFTPKNVVFPFIGMLCRLCLAAMHHNENAGRDQATTAAGKLVFKLAYPKSKRGECTVKSVKNDPTYIYVDELTRLVFHKVFLDPTPFVDELKRIHVPEDLSTQFDRPPKEEMIVSRFSRFPPKEVEILHIVQPDLETPGGSGAQHTTESPL
ncbi:uncharacterized protein LOC117545323 isoform X2 [Gymnodraco acuticeps]|uniref:Uncharacterized protein LOC117545323 isoform X2 n=1 Tax=Gymnodraco acuticeps TaxID=8218 RepID=A0A6P8U2K4_GYMAC|nr:uncharacterized protein LOC117545323 isoform X2 [Gymnodraco acuticeps]